MVEKWQATLPNHETLELKVPSRGAYMSTVLSEIEVRVLGSLVEKQVTTPEYYPLTLNALTLACNQKNNRSPVTSFDETQVAQALESLREKNLVYAFHGSTSRVVKYKHVMPEVMHLRPKELAIICVLMLRGPQTTGELRGNTSRFQEFTGVEEVEEVEEVLHGLSTREPESLVTRLPRQSGQKEARFAHLLSGEISAEALAQAEPSSKPGSLRRTEPDRVEKLEQEVTTLAAEVRRLQEQFEEFKRQFE